VLLLVSRRRIFVATIVIIAFRTKNSKTRKLRWIYKCGDDVLIIVFFSSS